MTPTNNRLLFQFVFSCSKWSLIHATPTLPYLLKKKHGALRPQKPLRLIRDEEVGGSEMNISKNLLAMLSPPE